MGTHELVNTNKYQKLIVAVFGAIVSGLLAVSGGHIGVTEILNLVLAGAGAFQVWYVTETKDNPHGKALIAALIAALMGAQTLIAAGTGAHLTDWLQVGFAALTAAGIRIYPTTATVSRLALPVGNVVNAGTPYAASTDTAPVPRITPAMVKQDSERVGPVGNEPGAD
jgi:hypothetical protein